jgi:hypothetical protein
MADLAVSAAVSEKKKYAEMVARLRAETGPESVVPLQTYSIKTCRDCPLLVEVSGNVLHELTGKNTYEGGPLYLCADDGEWADPDLVPGHECTLYEEGPMLVSLETPR